jgi:protein-L-isoaspartate(D-aspartate) O-methyltransferase
MNIHIIELQREKLFQELQQKGITSISLLTAFTKVRRERFVHQALAHRAYEDISLPIGKNQTISQPFTVATMTHYLDIQAGDSVLEIGTGSGYQAAILAELGATVHTIERHEELHLRTKKLLKSLGYTSIHCYLSDGTIGLPELAPFNKIIVTAGAPDIPKSLCQQLTTGGVLVVPIGDSKRQFMHVIKRNGEQDFDVFVSEKPFVFVPLVGEEGWSDKVESSNSEIE